MKSQKSVRFSEDTAELFDRDEILQRIGDSNLSKKCKIQKSLPKPLEKPQAKRIKRSVGYEDVAVEANKWGGLVMQRRKADQLKFPIEEADVRVITTEKHSKPEVKTQLQKEVYELLHGAKLVKPVQETEEEIEVKKAMSLKEIAEKSRENWRKKLLKERLEKKASLLHKSKSKKYHKILRKEKLRKKKEEFERLKETDPDEALKILEEIENSRVLERMNLRHRKSKWLHLKGLKAGRDKNVKEILTQNKEVCQELLEKIRNPNDIKDNWDEEFNINDNTKLTEKSRPLEHIENDEENEDFLKINSAFEMLSKEKQDAEPKQKNDNEDLLKITNLSSRQLGLARIQNPLNYRGIYELEDDEDNIQDNNLEYVFEDYDLIKDFQLEKKSKEEEKASKFKDEKLKGWGSWVGPGINTSNKSKKSRNIPEILSSNSKIIKPNILYNEKADVHESIRKHMVSELPYPYASIKDFEASVRQPIGRTFVPEISLKKLIAPPVLKKKGVVIKPLNEDSLLKNNNKNRQNVSKLENELNKKLNIKKIVKRKTSKVKKFKNSTVKPFIN